MKKVRNAFVYLTNECNTQCLHCFADSGKKKKDEMNTNEAIGLIEQIKDYGAKMIVLEGGELLLRKDINEIVDNVHKDVEIAITTNSSLLDDSILKSFKGKVKRIGFSLDGTTPETHDFLRQRTGSFNETINGIKKALNHRYTVKVWYTVSKPNLSEVCKVPELLQNEGLDAIKLLSFFTVSKTGRAKINWDKLKISKQEWKSHLKTMEQMTAEYDNIMFEPGMIPREDRKKYGGSYPACNLYIDKKMVHVDSSGNIYTCGLLLHDEKFSLGNIRDDTFRNIINKSEKWKLFEEYKSKIKEVCDPCEDYSFCKGGCIAYSTHDEGNFSVDSRCSKDFIPLCLHYFHSFKK